MDINSTTKPTAFFLLLPVEIVQKIYYQLLLRAPDDGFPAAFEDDIEEDPSWRRKILRYYRNIWGHTYTDVRSVIFLSSSCRTLRSVVNWRRLVLEHFEFVPSPDGPEPILW